MSHNTKEWVLKKKMAFKTYAWDGWNKTQFNLRKWVAIHFFRENFPNPIDYDVLGDTLIIYLVKMRKPLYAWEGWNKTQFGPRRWVAIVFSKKSHVTQFIVILLGHMNYVFSKHVDKIDRKP